MASNAQHREEQFTTLDLEHYRHRILGNLRQVLNGNTDQRHFAYSDGQPLRAAGPASPGSPVRLDVCPAHLGPAQLLAALSNYPKCDGDGVQYGYKLPERHRTWHKAETYPGDVSGTSIERRLVVVASSRQRPIGLTNILATIHLANFNKPESAYLSLSLDSIWVAPNRRGRQVGTMLASGAAALACDIYYQLATELPDCAILEAAIYCDYMSEGGENLCRLIHTELELLTEAIAEIGDVGDIVIHPPLLDAGY